MVAKTYRQITTQDQLIFDAKGNLVGVRNPYTHADDLFPGTATALVNHAAEHSALGNIVTAATNLTGVIDLSIAGNTVKMGKIGGTTIALFGDSITGHNYTAAFGAGYGAVTRAEGYFIQANIAMGWPFNITVFAGVSSDTTALMLARINTDVLAYPVDWCCVMGGSNDISTATTVAQTTANLQSIYAKLMNAGIKVLACTIMPTDAHVSIPSIGYKRKQVNEWIKSFASGHVGKMLVADTERAILDPATGGPLAGMLIDGVHPTNTGAAAAGRAITAAVSSFVSTFPLDSAIDCGWAINPLANGSNSKTAGGFNGPAGITGVGPNSWDGFVRNTGTAVGSKVTRTNWMPEKLWRMTATFAAEFDQVGVYVGGSSRVTKGRYDQAWAANTAYGLDDRKKPTVANGNHYVCTVAGTSHATTEPTWPTTPGATITDGTVTWRCHPTPLNGEQYFAVAEFDASSLSGGAQPQLELMLGYTDGTFQNAVACGLINVSNSFGPAPNYIAPTGRLVTPILTLDLSVKTIRYLYALAKCTGPAGGSVVIDWTRINIVKVGG